MPIPNQYKSPLQQVLEAARQQAQLQSLYKQEMQKKYTAQMPTFNDWMTQRQNITKKADGGTVLPSLVQLSATDPALFNQQRGYPQSAYGTGASMRIQDALDPPTNTIATQEDYNNAVNNVNNVLNAITSMSPLSMITHAIGSLFQSNPYNVSPNDVMTEEENQAAVEAAVAADAAATPDSSAANSTNGMDVASDNAAATGQSDSSSPAAASASSGDSGGEAHGGSIHARHNTRDIDAMRLALMPKSRNHHRVTHAHHLEIEERPL